MSQPAHRRGTALPALRWVARGLALAAAYFVVAKIGLRYATIGPSISPVWPPTGLAVGALALLGPGYWPAILAHLGRSGWRAHRPAYGARNVSRGGWCRARDHGDLRGPAAGVAPAAGRVPLSPLSLRDRGCAAVRAPGRLASDHNRGDARRRLHRAGGRSLRHADRAEHRHRA